MLDFRFSATVSMEESERNGPYNTMGWIKVPFQPQPIKQKAKTSQSRIMVDENILTND